jgi:threonine dehydrogenase-like Zn-dependent dehydrogenase
MWNVTRKDVEEIEYDRGPNAIPGIKFHAAARALGVTAWEIVRRCVTIRGVHNYAPRHLLAALEFVQAHRGRLPLGDLVDTRFPIEAADAALAAAAERRALRPAVVP